MTARKTTRKSADQKKFENGVVAEAIHLRRLALKRTRNPAMADDLVQETMLLALSNRHRFQMGTNLRAWLTTILKNAHLNQIRKDKRNTEYVENLDSATRVASPTQETHMELLDIGRAVASLPRSQRDVVMVQAFQSSSYEETARRCRCTLGTVKSRLSRARASLNQHMASTTPRPDYDVGARVVAAMRAA
ncbi:MAG: sigma-70 family RNA polymerase sigma factor [Pseudomonadota bacterium]|nr:sigma-70 family RNA polymerase sigma factor [Pseudomonadota bacterium]